MPSDRNDTFEPLIVPKGERHLDSFDDRILSLYARGMTIREIRAHVQEIYGVAGSPDLISRVTDALLEEVREWQNRPLDAVYPVVRSIRWCSSTRSRSRSATRAWSEQGDLPGACDRLPGQERGALRHRRRDRCLEPPGTGLVVPTSRATAIAALLRHCILEWGVPEAVRTDEGKDYTSRHVLGVLADLEIEHRPCPPYTPEAKPFVERFLGTLTRDLFASLPGFPDMTWPRRRRAARARALRRVARNARGSKRAARTTP